MECTFLLGKAPPPKRKKAHTEVEILEARLETIESAYSERLSQMESLLNRVMPGAQLSDLGSAGVGSSSTKTSTSRGPALGNHQRQGTVSTNDSEWADIDSPTESSQPVSNWDRSAASVSEISDLSNASRSSPTLTTTPALAATPNIDTPMHLGLKEETYEGGLFPSTSKGMQPIKSSSPLATTQPHVTTQDESDSDDDGELGELAVTMDKLRLFDASLYYGKGTMLFTSTDQNKFWDEEITFDVHDTPDIVIPPEAFVMPSVEVIDELFDIYYRHYYTFLPMVQKTALLRALEDRYEPQSIFLLNSVFTVAALTGECKHPSCFSDPDDPKSVSTPFFERARLVLDYCIGIPRVSTVQGLILLSRYPKISGLGIHYIQQAILMASDMGLHRKCDRWIPDKQVQETRKRVFWCIYMVDSSSASITGRRPLFHDSEVDVPQLSPTATEGEEEYSTTLFLVQMCQLWRIYRNVKRYVFNATEVQAMVPGSLPKSYEQQLIQWQLQLPAALRFSFDIKPGDPKAMYNARGGVAQMLYESTLILLHQPYITSPEHLKRSPYRSQDICIKAASKITEIAKVLAKTYSQVYEITASAEYALTNAIRIHVMYMKSSDAKIAEMSQNNFDYLVRFFQEFYAAPRGNIDEQTINCILTFFDEFIHTVKGLSESTVHICAGAIKSMAIAKRSKIPLGKLPGGDQGSKSASSRGGGRNLSKLVKIGREERAKAKLNSMTSPSLSVQETLGVQRKRHSHLQHDDQRYAPDHFLQQGQHQRPESISSSLSSHTSAQDSTGTYSYPGKVQKLSQYVGPFGGPLAMESLNQYQTSTTILNQPLPSSAIPQTSNVLGSTSGGLHPFILQQQLQFQQQQQQHLGQSPQLPQQRMHLQQQQLLDQASQPMGTTDAMNSQFWCDFSTISAQGDLQVNAQTLSTNIIEGGISASHAMDVNTSHGSPTTSIFSLTQSIPQQQQHVDPQGVNFPPMKVDGGGGGGIFEGTEEDLTADQIQALLEQTLAEDTRNNPNNPINIINPLAQQQQQHQQQQHHEQQQRMQNQRIEQSAFREDFNIATWQNMI
ncbi:Transcriptional activator of fatty acid utilization [Mortierella sp. AD010]|nr:Transcriptional activator of fatty acid utilization [Mortierella sp. AD010]